MILSLFRRSETQNRARELYGEIITQARQPFFYEVIGVPDTVEGRFDLLTVHSYLVLRRLKQEGAAHEHFANKLFETMVQDLDSNLREIGVGDLTVGKKVRSLTEAFLGRAAQYERAIKATDRDAMARSLAKNVMSDEQRAHADEISLLVTYVFDCVAALQDQSLERLMRGLVVFPDPKAIQRKKAL